MSPRPHALERALTPVLAATVAAVLATSHAAVPAAAEPAAAAPSPSSPSHARAPLPAGEKLVSPQRANPKSRLTGDWGIYKGPAELSWRAFEGANASQKQKLRYIVDAPKPVWYGSWTAPNAIGESLTKYIKASQNGDPNVLVQLTIFRMQPWYTEGQKRKPTAKEVADYKRWVRNSAKAIGRTRTAIYLQPDSTFLRTVPNFKLSAGLIKYAAKTYGALPNTLVYLETGGHDWPSPGQGGVKEAVRLLTAQGMKYADGVVTNTTHYNKTAWDVKRIADISKAFAKKGKKGVKGVVNTSSNGKGFDFGKYKGGGHPDHAKVCSSKKLAGTCVTLGIPPTTDVANPRWGLDAKTRKLALKYVDAYAWVGRPWLYMQTSPFEMKRALKLIETTPFR